MQTFTFNAVTRIVFGAGTFAQIGEIAAEFGTRALVISNADRSGKRGLSARLQELLSTKNVALTACGLDGEPTVADVDRCLAAARSAGCDVVIGIGGGSAIDCAKAVAGLLTNGGGALDYMEVVGKGQKIARPAAPWIAIPTTAGTGAEVTRNAVIGAPEHQFKASLRSEHLLARVALVDPELQLQVSPEVTARSGMDALTQCIEAYTSKNANPLTDPLAREGIERAIIALPQAYEQGSNVEARSSMALSALLSGVALTNAGLGAVHGFAAPMGARYPVPHGTVCAILLPYCTQANIEALQKIDREHPALLRYAQVGACFTFGQPPGDLDQSLEELVDDLHELGRRLNIPRLRDYGVKDDHIADVVAAAQKANSMKTNPVALSAEELTDVLRAAL
jgi:alcohol dehydrogenase class IV